MKLLWNAWRRSNKYAMPIWTQRRWQFWAKNILWCEVVIYSETAILTLLAKNLYLEKSLQAFFKNWNRHFFSHFRGHCARTPVSDTPFTLWFSPPYFNRSIRTKITCYWPIETCGEQVVNFQSVIHHTFQYTISFVEENTPHWGQNRNQTLIKMFI